MTIYQKRALGIILGFLSIGFTTWLELFLQKNQQLVGGGLSRTFLFLFINLHMVMVVILLYLITRQSIKLFLERRKGVPGSVFKRNLLFAFILFSVIPSFFVFFTAGKFITKSIDRWFQVHLGGGFESALALHEQHTQALRQDIALHGSIIEQHLSLIDNPSDDRAIQEQLMIARRAYPAMHAYKVYAWHILNNALSNALQDEVQVWRAFRVHNDRSTKSLQRCFLEHLKDVGEEAHIFDFYGSLYWAKHTKGILYLVVYRYPEPVRTALIGLTNAMIDYQQLYQMRSSIYVSYFFTFALITLVILFLSMWCAFYLAKGISKPIQELLDATHRVRSGQWDYQIQVSPSSDLQLLAHGFNQMTSAVRQAHASLELKNGEMLAILENISGAVFLMNKYGRIIFHNNAAQALASQYIGIWSLKGKKIDIFGHALRDQCVAIAREMLDGDKKQLTKEITLTVADQLRTFVVYGVVLSLATSVDSYQQGMLVVIEDVTDIVKEKTLKTWQEAAKQMAHEIKNPLTPIQLATQRLQRKFKNELSDNPIFLDCTNTILDQVKIIKDLVSHFAEFASMPAVRLGQADMCAIVRDVLCLYQVSYPEIDFVQETSADTIMIETDKEKIKLILINLLDNSVRAIKKCETLEQSTEKKRITISLYISNDRKQLNILFVDNGPGIPQTVKDTLFLPYVSTEKKNMGLGLAIVHDLISQLGGLIVLVPASSGASFHIILPL